MLFCPGNHARRVAKVFDAGADAAILDLEDAVAVAEKVAARSAVVEALRRPRPCLGYVRVNAIATPFCHDDLFAVVGPHLDGVLVPKIERPEELAIADWALAQAERAAGLPVGHTDLIPILETAAGVLRAEALIGAVPRVKRASFGAGDFTLDTGMTWTKHGRELLWARTFVVLASRAAGREPPLDTVYFDLRDPEGFGQDTQAGRELGFQGRMLIHPDQVAAANRIYAPSETELAWSRRVVDAFTAAEAAGLASIQLDGQFVDYPIYEKAARTLALGRRLGLVTE